MTTEPRGEWVIFVVALAGIHVVGPEPDGSYIVAYDPDAYGGGGHADLTRDPAAALGFPNAAAAAEFWRQQSRVRPLRGDGKPNRPLTACTIEILRRDERPTFTGLGP